MGSEIGGLLSGLGGDLFSWNRLSNLLVDARPSNESPNESTTLPINAGPTLISMVLESLPRGFLVQYHLQMYKA